MEGGVTGAGCSWELRAKKKPCEKCLEAVCPKELPENCTYLGTMGLLEDDGEIGNGSHKLLGLG